MRKYCLPQGPPRLSTPIHLHTVHVHVHVYNIPRYFLSRQQQDLRPMFLTCVSSSSSDSVVRNSGRTLGTRPCFRRTIPRRKNRRERVRRTLPVRRSTWGDERKCRTETKQAGALRGRYLCRWVVCSPGGGDGRTEGSTEEMFRVSEGKSGAEVYCVGPPPGQDSNPGHCVFVSCSWPTPFDCETGCLPSSSSSAD